MHRLAAHPLPDNAGSGELAQPECATTDARGTLTRKDGTNGVHSGDERNFNEDNWQDEGLSMETCTGVRSCICSDVRLASCVLAGFVQGIPEPAAGCAPHHALVVVWPVGGETGAGEGAQRDAQRRHRRGGDSARVRTEP